jgi:hypothetical protein
MESIASRTPKIPFLVQSTTDFPNRRGPEGSKYREISSRQGQSQCKNHGMQVKKKSEYPRIFFAYSKIARLCVPAKPTGDGKNNAILLGGWYNRIQLAMNQS